MWSLPFLLNLMLTMAFAETQTQFIENQLQTTIQKIESRQFDEAQLRTPYRLNLEATRTALTDWLYDQKFVEYSDLTLMYSDKLIMGKLLYHYLKADAPKYTPLVIGLKEFLEKEQLLDNNGIIVATEEELKTSFKKYFPEGFVMKPPVSWATDGKGFYTKENEVAALLAANDPKLYDAQRDKTPFHPPTSDKISSGERWMLMGKIKNTGLLDGSKKKINREFRVHTFHQHVIPAATHHRYGLDDSDEHFELLNQFASNLLKALPRKMVEQQAWSLDIFLQADNQPILIEVNSNRGRKANWSDFTRDPYVLAGYVNFFETQYAWSFQGIEGQLLRLGIGNMRSHLKHELIFYRDLAAETKEADAQAEILASIKHMAEDYQQKLILVRILEAEASNKNYRTTVYVISELSSRINKVQSFGDAAWQDFAQWMDWYIQWDGSGL